MASPTNRIAAIISLFARVVIKKAWLIDDIKHKCNCEIGAVFKEIDAALSAAERGE